MKRVVVEGKRYLVLDNMGFQHSRGLWAVEVQTPEGPRVATRSSLRGAPWVWSAAAVAPRLPATGQ